MTGWCVQRDVFPDRATTRRDDDEVASADGIRFVVPVATVHVGPNPKYFGIGRGVTYYNLSSLAA